MPFTSFIQSLSCVSVKSSKSRKSFVPKTINSDGPASIAPSAPHDESSDNIPDVVQRSTHNRSSTFGRSATLNSNSTDNGTFSFWDIGHYNKTLKRCDDGYNLGDQLSDMISERAKLEEEYAKSIKKWSSKWNEYLNKSPEYQTTKEGWESFLKLGSQTADIHMDMCKELLNKPVNKIKDWLDKRYKKHIFNFKQTNEFKNDFENAERSWVELNDKLNRAKRDYYQSVKNTKTSEEKASQSKSDPKLNQEQRDKLEDKAIKAREDEEKARKNYKDTLKEIELYKDHHQSKMVEVFDKTQNFEKERILFFKQTFLECDDILKIHQDERFDHFFDDYSKNINKMNPADDLSWWSKTFGVETKPNWPAFEEYIEK